MNETVPIAYETTPTQLPFYRAISWGAIFAGFFAAVAVQLLLTLLGTSIGLGVFAPLSDPDPIKNFGVGAAIVWTVAALISLWVGGCVAGFFANKVNHRSGSMHGLVVWCVVLVVSFTLVSMGVGLTAGGAVEVVGKGLGMGGTMLAGAAGGAGMAAGGGAKGAMQSTKNELSSFLDQVAPDSGSNAMGTNAGNMVRARREIGFAVTKLFAPENENSFASNRTATIQALTEYGGMSQADATKTVDEWVSSYNNLKAELKSLKEDAEAKARQEADRAAHNLAWASAVSFVAFLLGLSFACMGGGAGGCCAVRSRYYRTTTSAVTNPDVAT